MGNEEQRAAASSKLAVVKRRYDGLSGTSRGDNEIAVPSVAIPLNRERFEHSLLILNDLPLTLFFFFSQKQVPLREGKRQQNNFQYGKKVKE